MRKDERGRTLEPFEEVVLSVPDIYSGSVISKLNVRKGLMQQMKSGVADLYTWIKENQGDLVTGYQFIQSIIKNRGELPAEPTGEPLPNING